MHASAIFSRYKTWLCLLAMAAALCSAPLYGAAAPALFTVPRAEALLTRYVLANSQWAAEDVELKVTQFPPVTLPAGPFGHRVLKSTRGVTPGTTSFLLALDVAGKEHARLWVKAEVRVFEEVVVTSAPLAARELVQAKDLRVERRELSTLNGRSFKRIEEVEGQQALRAVAINEVLTQKFLDRPALMRRGSPVTLIYETRTLRVESPGLAVEGGRAGDAIQVKNPSSGKILRGIIVDARTVRIN
jgi:flagella basal body P-ring formation protein FlgA